MAIEIPGEKNGLCVAAADLSAKQFLFVKITAAFAVNVATASGEAVLGVLQNNPKSGQSATVMVTGVTKVVAGAAIAAGARVQSNATGAAITATATAGHIEQGFALEAAAAAGDVISVQLERVGQI